MSVLAAMAGVNSQPVSVSVSPGVASGSRRGAGTVTTNGITATGSGGAPGYTYVHSYVSGDAVFTATASTSASTAFTATLNINDVFHAIWQVVATDSLGTASPAQTYIVNAKETSFL